MTGERDPTLSDVARRAGVGTTTVSRVINGGERVSPETLEVVRRAIAELRFVPNIAARVLKGEKCRTIGLIVPSIADSFFAGCAEEIQKVARGFGSLVFVTASHNDPILELENVENLFRRTDGLLIAPSDSNGPLLIDRLTSLSIPVVCFDRPLRDDQIPSVLTDNYQSAKAATQHLLQHGYRHIICLGGEAGSYPLVERMRGYEAAMRAANRKPVIDVSAHRRNAEELVAALNEHLNGKTPPQAIFSLEKTTTVYAYIAMQRLDLRIPQQIALIGFDDFVLADSLCPAITVIQQPIEEIGRRAAKLLFDNLALSDNSSFRLCRNSNIIRIKSRMIIRESCGCDL